MRSKQDNSKYDFYRRNGVNPPSHEEHGTDKDLEELRNWAGEHNHKWVQKGPFIECSQGNVVHGAYAPSVNHILSGTNDDGTPRWRVLTPAPKDD